MRFTRFIWRVALTSRGRSSLLLPLSLLLVSCSGHALRKFDQQQEKVASHLVTEIRRQENDLPTSNAQRLDWNSALALMAQRNLPYKRAEERIALSLQQKNRLWREMIPAFSVGVSDSGTIGDLGSAFTDPNIRVNSFLALGNLLRMPKESYRQEFLVIGADLAAQESYRQQTIALYRLFREGELLRAEKKEIALIDQLAQLRKSPSQRNFSTTSPRLISWQEKHHNWETKIAQFFNSTPGKITLIPKGLPKLNYQLSDLDFTKTSRWGGLPLKMAALRELATDGRIAETYLRYLPRPSFGVSAPALYSSGNSQSFDPSLTRISPSLSWRLDTRGDISRQIKRLKTQKTYQTWQDDHRRRDEISQLLQGREALREVRTEKARFQKMKAQYRKLLESGMIPPDAPDTFDTLIGFARTEIALRAKEEDLITSFWLIDDSRWSQSDLPWKKK